MTTVTFKGTPVRIDGHFPQQGEQAPSFSLVNKTLDEVTLSSLSGFRKVVNIFPSIDTGVCAASARHFNEDASALENTVVINISKDLPFALGRFCASEGLKNVINLSDYRSNFGETYGLTIADSPLKGLLSRAVVVLDENGVVKYTEQVPEIAQEPDYTAALEAIK